MINIVLLMKKYTVSVYIIIYYYYYILLFRRLTNLFSILSDATNILGPSQVWSTKLDDDQLSIAHSTAHSTTSKRGHDNINGPDPDGFFWFGSGPNHRNLQQVGAHTEFLLLF